MENIEKFKAPMLPKMLGGNVICVDAKAWNDLISYVTKQTVFINRIIEATNQLVVKESQDSDSIKQLANILKEHLEEWKDTYF